MKFGLKLSVGLVEGIAYIDHFSWEAYNESTYSHHQVEAYYKRYRYYPEVVIGDRIYGRRENRFRESHWVGHCMKEKNKQQIAEDKNCL